MDLKLNKLPWYGQVGLFVVAGDRPHRRLLLVLRRAGAGRNGQPRAETGRASRHHRERVGDRESAEPVPRAGRRARRRGSRASRPCCPSRRTWPICCGASKRSRRQSNLAIQGFKPAPSVTKQLHAEWPIALQLDGTYHNLAMFFDRVSKFSRIINVSNITIRGKEKPQPNSTISVDCVATTFVLLETAKPAAPGAKAN